MESVLNSFQEGKWCGEVDEIRHVMVMHLVLVGLGGRVSAYRNGLSVG